MTFSPVRETIALRATQTVYAQFSRMGWNYWTISQGSKIRLDRSVANSMINEGAKKVVIG